MSPGLSAGEAVRRAARAFAGEGIETSGLDARLIVMHATGLSHEALLRAPEQLLSEDQCAEIDRLSARRLAREPLARIFGRWRFRDLDFALNAATLVPRPETEMVVACAQALCGDGAGRIADIGTGSGCILLGLLHALPQARGVGTDASAQAIAAARANAESLGLAARASFFVTDWLVGVDGPFDVIVSNPPYIVSEDIAGLAPEVRDNDPRLALDGGADGLAAFRALVPQAAARLKPGGWLVLETGTGQHNLVTTVLQDAGLAEIKSERDLAGHERLLRARRPL